MLALAAAMFAVAPWIIDARALRGDDGPRLQDLLLPHAVGVDVPDRRRSSPASRAAGSCSSSGRRADGWALAAAELDGAVRRVHAGHRAAVGAQGVGRVVGVGRAAHLEPDAVHDLRRLLLLRRYGGPGSDKLGAGMALFGMANVPFIYVSVNYWRTLHPPTSVVPTLPVEMGIPLWYCVTAFTLLFIVLLRLRARLEHQRARVEALYLAEDEA